MVNSIFTQGEPLSHIFTYGSMIQYADVSTYEFESQDAKRKINPNSMLTGATVAWRLEQ